MDPQTEAALAAFATRLSEVAVIDAVWVAGSLATGDHVPGVSDLDLVSLTRGPVDPVVISQVHHEMDAGPAAGMDLGCQYVDRSSLGDLAAEHPTWTHGELLDRCVSLVTRVELVLHGFALIGPSPQEVLPAARPGDVRRAAQAELAGYWSWAAKHPRMFISHPVMVDLGLSSMARGRHAIEHDRFLTKSAAIELARAPEWLKHEARARRRGQQVTSPRWTSAWIVWRDVRRTVRSR